jgi:hypothetical protein
MTESLSVHRLQPLIMSNASRGGTLFSRIANFFRTASKQRDLVVVVGFCAIGLILTLALAAQLPDFSAAMVDISLIP